MMQLAHYLDGTLRDLQFVIVMATIALAVLNILITGRPGVGLAVAVYRVTFAGMAMAAGTLFIGLDDQGITPQPLGLLFMVSADLMMLARLYAVRADRRAKNVTVAGQEADIRSRRAWMCAGEKVRDWLMH